MLRDSVAKTVISPAVEAGVSFPGTVSAGTIGSEVWAVGHAWAGRRPGRAQPGAGHLNSGQYRNELRAIVAWLIGEDRNVQSGPSGRRRREDWSYAPCVARARAVRTVRWCLRRFTRRFGVCPCLLGVQPRRMRAVTMPIPIAASSPRIETLCPCREVVGVPDRIRVPGRKAAFVRLGAERVGAGQPFALRAGTSTTTAGQAADRRLGPRSSQTCAREGTRWANFVPTRRTTWLGQRGEASTDMRPAGREADRSDSGSGFWTPLDG